MRKKLLPPIHPGEILLEEFLKPLGISQYRLAGNRRACPAHRGHHSGQACHYRRHGSPLVSVLRAVRRLLAARTGAFRYRDGQGYSGRRAGEDQAVGK